MINYILALMDSNEIKNNLVKIGQDFINEQKNMNSLHQLIKSTELLAAKYKKYTNEIINHFNDYNYYKNRPRLDISTPECKHSFYLLGWRPGDKTHWHNHGDTQGVAIIGLNKVLNKEFRENSVPTEREINENNPKLIMDKEYIHMIENPKYSGETAFTIHSYMNGLNTAKIFDSKKAERGIIEEIYEWKEE